jgi:hypothetical protein
MYSLRLVSHDKSGARMDGYRYSIHAFFIYN